MPDASDLHTHSLSTLLGTPVHTVLTCIYQAQKASVKSWVQSTLDGTTGHVQSRFSSGEVEKSTTSKEGRRYANYPFLIKGGSDEK